MKKKTLIFMFLLIGILFRGTGETVEEIIAVVNDDIITRSDYERQLQAIYQIISSQLKGEDLQKQYTIAKKNLLETMIRDMLLLQAAREKGIDVTEEVNLNIENIKKENNILSDEQLRQELAKQGMSLEGFKKQMEENFLRQAVVLMEVDRGIVLEDSEIISYYKLHPEEFTEPAEYKLRAIYLSLEGKSKEELESKKEEISQRLKNGEEMAALATQYSEGPEKEYQGDLGSFKKGELEKTLEQAIEKLNPGEITPWLETRNGWWLLKLEEKKERRLKPFEDVRDDVENKLFTERKQKKLEEFFKKLREKSYVKILNPYPAGR